MGTIKAMKEEIHERARDLIEYHSEFVEQLGDTSELIGPFEALVDSFRELDRRVEYDHENDPSICAGVA